jgi:hypothetical protein
VAGVAVKRQGMALSHKAGSGKTKCTCESR